MALFRRAQPSSLTPLPLKKSRSAPKSASERSLDHAMKNPLHPGGVVLRQCLEPLGLSITEAAAALGVTRTTLSELVNGKRGMPCVSKRFSAAAPFLTEAAITLFLAVQLFFSIFNVFNSSI
jgi:hypothetical protein